MSVDLEYLLYGPDFTYVDRFIADTSTAIPGWSSPGVAMVTLPHNHRIVGKLEPGSRLQVRYRGHKEIEGYIWAHEGQGIVVPGETGPRVVGSVVLEVIDDADFANALLGWPNPGSAITAQTSEFARYEGPLETALKSALSANIARLGLPWTVVPTLGLGDEVTVDLRFHRIAEEFSAHLKAQNMGLVVTRLGTGAGAPFRFDVQRRDALDRPLTLESGVVSAYKWRTQRPEASRLVGGGMGTGAERILRAVVNSSREATWGVREAFADQRSAETGSQLTSALTTDLSSRGETTGLEATIAEGSWFTYHDAYELGDIVPVEILTVPFEAAIQTVTIDDTPSDGVRVTPTIGDFANPKKLMSRKVRRILRRVMDMERR